MQFVSSDPDLCSFDKTLPPKQPVAKMRLWRRGSQDQPLLPWVRLWRRRIPWLRNPNSAREFLVWPEWLQTGRKVDCEFLTMTMMEDRGVLDNSPSSPWIPSSLALRGWGAHKCLNLYLHLEFLSLWSPCLCRFPRAWTGSFDTAAAAAVHHVTNMWRLASCRTQHGESKLIGN